MLVFLLTMSCFPRCNLPWFMDLTFRVPVQYCSLHQILLSSLDTSITEHRFCFGPAASFFLGLLVILRSSPIACCTPSDLGNSSFAVISFCPFMQFMRFSQQVYWGVCLCSSSGSRFVRNLHWDPSVLGGPTWHGSWLHWVKQAPLLQQGSDLWRGDPLCI